MSYHEMTATELFFQGVQDQDVGKALDGVCTITLGAYCIQSAMGLLSMVSKEQRLAMLQELTGLLEDWLRSDLCERNFQKLLQIETESPPASVS